ncbi:MULTISPECIES: alpha/beta fold hydrolase [Asticcacaulis]|uniref:alpha/beta fold hydrolase n=1 Tax=Asticcacaulis TaxID=76890 RepID=UPI001AE56ABD|nr:MULTISPECIES: alpha/beta hydrolase [Asticcacaulis]MBP2158698.1 pimeloyl-ACP methyl ester carboxylesterase [Asticcacaulis solisilvae]MDR6799744.1 pimeloyl-ACP methyl ester carboxylesterase [Asticcacaulis sp. BE141]
MKKLISTLAAIAAGLALALPACAGDFKSDRIIVTTTGEGKDVVLIPGLSSSASVWDTTIQALPGYRYHVVQVKGFAGVPAEANATGPVVAPLAEEVARYIVSEKLDRPAVTGHSMGGTVGMMVAARHPGLVSRLMVVDMIPFMGAMFMPNATPDSVAPIAGQIRDGIRNAPAAGRQATAEQTIAGMIKTEAFRPAAIKHAMDSDPATSGQAMYELITTDLRPELANIKVPLRVLWVLPPGAPITAEQMAGYYQMSYANAPNASLRQVTDSCHFIMFDQPELFQAELKTFIQ